MGEQSASVEAQVPAGEAEVEADVRAVETEARPAPSLVVAVHDIAPSTLYGTRWLLDRLDALGLKQRSLLAIPDDADRGPLRRGDEVSALLAAEADGGAEIVLHGLTHARDGRFVGPWAQRLRALAFASRDAEFQALTATAMAERLIRGRSILREAVGITPAGFCAPAWLAAPGLTEVLQREGFGFEVCLLGVRGLSAADAVATRRAWVRAPSLGSMGVGGVHEALVTIGGALSLAAAAWLPWMSAIQVFLHPQDAARSAAAARTLATIERLLRTHQPTSYARLVG